jgi:hypothetical protein
MHCETFAYRLKLDTLRQESPVMLARYIKISLLVLTVMQLHTAFASESSSGPRLGLPEQTHTYIDRSYGFTLDLPLDFSLSSEQGDLLFFRSSNRPGTFIIRPRPGLSLSTVQAALRNGFDNEQIVLKTTGSPETLELNGAQGLGMEVQGTVEGREVHGMMAGIFGHNGQGYMVLVGSVRERWRAFRSSAINTLQSFTATPVQRGNEYERWEQRLIGKRLIFAEGYGSRFRGGAHIGEYHFCSDFRFMQLDRSVSTYSDGWGRYTSSGSKRRKGTWRVRIESTFPRVVLSQRRGVEMLDLAESEGYVLLNNVPYRYAVNELCE